MIKYTQRRNIQTLAKTPFVRWMNILWGL